MNITTHEIDAVNAVITVQIEKNDYQEKVADTLKTHSKKMDLPGFRKGNVPFSLVKKMLGKTVLIETINKLISENLPKYIEENKLKLLGSPLPDEKQPEIDFDNDENFEFHFDIAFAPQFELDLSLEETPYYNIRVEDKMVEDEIQQHIKHFGKYENVDTIEENDIINGGICELDANGDVKAGGITVENSMLFPRTMVDKDQQTLFTGIAKGEAVVFNPKKAFENEIEISSLLRITKEQAQELVSDFKITVEEIIRFKEAEINQDLFNKVFGEGQVNGEEEFRQKIHDRIVLSMEDLSNAQFKTDVRNILTKKLENMPFPETFLKRFMKEEFREKQSDEELEHQYLKMIEEWKWHVIKDKIIESKNIEVTQNDITQMAQMVVWRRMLQRRVHDVSQESFENSVKTLMKDEKTMQNMVFQIEENKVFGALKSSVKLMRQEVSFEDFEMLKV